MIKWTISVLLNFCFVFILARAFWQNRHTLAKCFGCPKSAFFGKESFSWKICPALIKIFMSGKVCLDITEYYIIMYARNHVYCTYTFHTIYRCLSKEWYVNRHAIFVREKHSIRVQGTLSCGAWGGMLSECGTSLFPKHLLHSCFSKSASGNDIFHFI